jgi:uncharacterized protein
VTQDINRPLGQKGGGASTRPRPRPLLVALRRWAGGAGAVAVIAVASLYVALRPEPFRNPQPLPPAPRPVVAARAPAVPEAPVQGKPAVATKVTSAPGGPAIITVDPSRKQAASGAVVIRDPMHMQLDPRTAHLPDPDLIERTPYGPLPKRGQDGLRPMDVYARPWSGARGPRIAIVIGGLGLSQTGTQAAIAALPGQVTLAFSPQGNSLQRWMQDARQGGHEILMQIPLEPFGYPQVDPGRDTLTVGDDAQTNLDRLHRSMARITNYTGVVNYMGARFTADAAAMEPVMADIARRGLLYLDDGTSARSVAGKVAQEKGAPFAAADLVIDEARDRGAILKKLDELERIARANGSAIGEGSAFDVTVGAVVTWIKEAELRGIEIVPVSALVRDPEKQ